MVIFLLFSICCASLSPNERNIRQLSTSFRFSIGPNREITLSDPQDKRSLNAKQDEGQWYYVHLIKDDFTLLQEIANIRPDDEIIKNTFALYLTPQQLDKISPYILAKLIEPREKIEIIHPYTDINSFIVRTAPNRQLPSNDELYSIEKNNNDDTYIIQVLQNGLNQQEFNEKKRKVAKLLSETSTVKKVTTYSKPTAQNHIDIGYVQKNLQPFRRDTFSKQLIFDRYVHNRGLTGESEVITIEDSMIDFRHPMFRDDSADIEFNTPMKNHRKFAYYRWDGDMKSWLRSLEQEEHGTHTCGTLAGKSIVNDVGRSISQLFDGMAPDSKLVYAGTYDGLSALELEEIMRNFSSRISSNSWGDNMKYVDELNYKYGKLAFDNPQSIFIFAAGNYAITGAFTVIDPSGSKNVLCVGATTSPLLQSMQDFAIQSDEDESILIFGSLATDSKDFQFNSPFLGTPENQSDFVAIHFKPEDKKLCCQQMNGEYISVFYGDDKMEIQDFVESCDAVKSKGRFITEDVEGVEKLLNSRVSMKVTMNPNPPDVLEVRKSSVSSIGPGNKGIMKPDVCAPGDYIISAKSYLGNSSVTCEDINDGCGLVSKYGTSMATPSVAGSAALISQYFNSGRWIEKTKVDGTTLRALLINSARHPEGTKTPDMYLGHGVVDLSSVLPLEGEFGVQITRQDSIPSVAENGHIAAKIEVKSADVDLQITMSYLDVMLEQSSPIPLTRDLDLVVVSPTGEMYKGDHLLDNDTQHFSTNEKVIVRKEDVSVGTYTVHVYGNKFLDSKKENEELRQNFSVVATGDIENSYIDFSESQESPCKESDESNPGNCKCAEDELGPICQAKVVEGRIDEMIDIELEPRSIYRIRFSSDKRLDKMTFYTDYYNANKASVWLSPTCHLLPHEYESVDYFVAYEDFAKTISVSEHIKKESNELCVLVFANSDMKCNYHIKVNTSDASPTETPTLTETETQGVESSTDSSPASQEPETSIVSSPASQETETSTVSSPASQETETPTVSSPASQETETPTDSSPASQETETPTDSSPASQEPETSIVSSPASQETETPTDSSPASQETETSIVSSPASQEPETSIVSSPASQETETSTVSSPASQETETSTVSSPASQETETPTDSSPASQETETPTDSSPASQEPETSIVSSPASQETETPTDSSPASQETETSIVSSPASQETETSIVSSPASQETETPTDSSPASQETETPIVSSPASQETETPIVSSPASQEPETSIVSSPAPQETETSTDSSPAPQETETPIVSSPAPQETETPTDSSPASQETETSTDSSPAPQETESESGGEIQPNSGKSKKLSAGLIAAIVISSAIVLAVSVFLIVRCVKNKNDNIDISNSSTMMKETLLKYEDQF